MLVANNFKNRGLNMNKAGFEELRRILGDKWLDYYEANQRTIENLMSSGHKVKVINGYRPSADFIIATMIALEPRLEEYLYFFLLVCDDWDKILRAIWLDFAPSHALQKRKELKLSHRKK